MGCKKKNFIDKISPILFTTISKKFESECEWKRGERVERLMGGYEGGWWLAMIYLMLDDMSIKDKSIRCVITDRVIKIKRESDDKERKNI